MLSLTDEIKREIILDHYSSPNNKKEINDESYKKIRMDSDSCIDDITIFLKIENDVIKDAAWNGVACAISSASTDIFCDLIKDKTEEEALHLIEEYKNMIFEKEYEDEILDELNAFSNTHKQAARIKCATIGAEGIKKIINGEENGEN